MLGSALRRTRNGYTAWLERFEGRYLEPFVESFKVDMDEAGNIICSYLKSSQGRKQVEKEYLESRKVHISNFNALLLDSTFVRGSDLSAVESYGIQIGPNVYLVKAPTYTLAALRNRCDSSFLTVTGDEPAAVLETLSRLWDLSSTGVMQDAAKALVAAWELTPI